MYRNREGYRDPTAGRAVSEAMREYRTRQKNDWNRKYKIRNRPKVCVVSYYAGDTKKNVAAAIRCCRFVIREGYMPFASHLIYPQILNDDDPKEREIGTLFGLSFLGLCDEVWIFQDQRGLSTGMAAEEKEAKRLKKPIRYFDLGVVS